MVKQCHYCGKFISTKPEKARGAIQFDVSADFRKTRPDVPAHTYLCGKCAEDEEIVKMYKEAPWYAGHRKLGA